VRDISIKSTGQLVDELVTNSLKQGFALLSSLDAAEFERRFADLDRVLAERLAPDVAELIRDLTLVSLATWHAQEVVMHERDDRTVAEAGRNAQRANARRSEFIRRIDRLLGDAGITITTKTYG